MAKLNFVFANGTLTATGANTYVRCSSSDYMARTTTDGTRIEIRPIFGDTRLPDFTVKDYLDLTIDGVASASAADFVSEFNLLAGSQLGYNTKYPESLFSQHIELDTSVDEQVVPAWIITGHNGGYVTITAPGTNTGNIHVGESDVSPDSYALEPDKSITLEISDLSLIWVQSTTAGDVVDVIGVAKI